MKQYDVVIVGAGPAGGQLARELSAKGYQILVIDKEMEIGEPVYSTAAVPTETLKEFNLPKKITCRASTGGIFVGPTKRAEFKFNRIIGYTIDFKRLKKYLLHESIKKGTETIMGASVTHPLISGNRVIGVKYNSFEGSGEVYGRIIVDASGSSGILASQLGLRKTREERLSVGLEFLMENLKLERQGRCFEVYVGSTAIPSGYTWIAPTKKDEARVGACWIVDFLKKKSKNSLSYYLHRFIKNNNQTAKGQVVEIHSGYIYPNGGLKRTVMNNFLVIGEAACQTSPLIGEGIRHCMWSGRFAAEVISDCLKKRDSSFKILLDYQKKWEKYVGYRWKYSVILQKIIANFSDKEWDLSLDLLNRLDKERLLRFMKTEFTREDILQVFPKLTHLFI